MGKNVLRGKKEKRPIVYAICDKETGTILYIGKTKRLSDRIQCYRNPKFCHNVELKGLLVSRDWSLEILEDNKENIEELERQWIKELKGNLFNLDHGGEQNWRDHKRLPWMASKGIRCPSDLLLNHFRSRQRKLGTYEDMKWCIDCAREDMTVIQRVRYETKIAMAYYDSFKKPIDKWLFYTKDRMIACLNEHGS